MKQAEFKIQINAPREQVWKALWEDKSYREWTTVFAEGSYAVSDWKEGSHVQFLDGKGNGMYSIIDKITPNQYMSFRHMGEIRKGVEQPVDDTAKSWSGAKENYILTDSGNGTELVAQMDLTDEMYNYFKDKFPKALQKVKEISER